MTKDTSGPAFPHSWLGADDCGMTIRQYAAIKAMQGLLSNSDVMMHLTAYAQQQKRTVHDVVAGASVNYADTLLAELAKGE